MAHFIEHMIFMGSKKYPKENWYDTVINRHGGSNNAETDAEETCFYFDVPLPGLDATLDVFSNLFYEPLFLEDTIDRELSAIDSEFDQARQSNDVRCDAVLAQFLRGPAAKFNYGNRESLTKVSLPVLQKRAREFWQEHYKAEFMYLAVQAKLSLDELEALVEKHFAKLRRSNKPGASPTPTPDGRILPGRPRKYHELSLDDIVTEDLHKNLVFVEAIDNKIELILTWPLPSQAAEFRCKPAHFIEQLLDNEGVGSLIKRLKDLHLIQRGDSQIHEDGFDDNSMYSLFRMTLRLSKHGYKNVPVILENVQSYLRLLQREQVQWPGNYDELRQIYESQFRFQGELRMMDEVQRLSTYLKYFPEERVLDGCQLYFEYDEKLICSVLERIADTTPGILICSQQKRLPEDVTPIDKELVEYYTEAKYKLAAVPEKWKDAMKVPRGDPRIDLFAFPPPNHFVTTDFELYSKTSEGDDAAWEYPRKIVETDLYELWFKPDTKFKLPKLSVNMQLIVPLVWNNIRNTVLLDVFGSMLSRELVKVLYGANIAGYACVMLPKKVGVSITMCGFSQRLPSILSEVLSKLNEGFAQFASEEQFELTKEEMLCSYVNTLLYVDGLTAEVLSGIVDDVHFAAYDKYRVLHSISYADVLEFCEKLFRELRLKCLVQGNATEEGAQEFIQMIVDRLRPKAIDQEQRKKLELGAVQLPKGEMNFIRVAAFNKSDVNSSLCQYYELGPESIELNCAVQLMLMIMEEPLFDTLRTKKQLGYDVGAQVKYHNGLVGFCVCVLSKRNLDEVEVEVENFVLEEFGAHLEDLDDEDFDESRNALIELKGMPDQDLVEGTKMITSIHSTRCTNQFRISEKLLKFSTLIPISEAQRNWDEIWHETYCFDRLQKEREWLRGCTKQDVFNLYDRILDDAQRKLLCVQVKGNASGTTAATEGCIVKGEEDENGEQEKRQDFRLNIESEFEPNGGSPITDIDSFKGRCGRYFRQRENL